MSLGSFGQPRVEALVQKMLQQQRLGGSILIEGPMGSGKEAFAVEIGRLVNCENENPCPPRGLFRQPPSGERQAEGTCSSCHRFMQLQHPDLHVVFPLPTNTWEREPKVVREVLQEKATDPYHKPSFERPVGIQADVLRDHVLPIVARRPVEAKVKVIVLSDADRMAFGVGNLLLKTLEEPPADCLLLLTSAVPERLLPTILSRCQRLRLVPLVSDWMIERLQLLYGCNPTQAKIASLVSQGSMYAAHQILDGIYEGARDRAFEALELAGECQLFDLLDVAADTAREYGKQRTMFPLFLHLVALAARDALLVVEGAVDQASPLVNDDRKRDIDKIAKLYSSEALRRIIRQTEEAEREIAGYAHSGLTLDSLFLDAARHSNKAVAVKSR